MKIVVIAMQCNAFFMKGTSLVWIDSQYVVNPSMCVMHCSKDIIDFGINLNPGWRIVLRLLEQWQNFESMNTRPNHWINLSIYKKLKYKAE